MGAEESTAQYESEEENVRSSTSGESEDGQENSEDEDALHNETVKAGKSSTSGESEDDEGSAKK